MPLLCGLTLRKKSPIAIGSLGMVAGAFDKNSGEEPAGWKIVRGLPWAGLGSKLERRGARRRGSAAPSRAGRGSDCSGEVAAGWER
jgi:hypothetical protein